MSWRRNARQRGGPRQAGDPFDYVWEEVKPHLASARVAGMRPDYLQTWHYVAKVQERFRLLTRPRGPLLARLTPAQLRGQNSAAIRNHSLRHR